MAMSELIFQWNNCRIPSVFECIIHWGRDKCDMVAMCIIIVRKGDIFWEFSTFFDIFWEFSRVCWKIRFTFKFSKIGVRYTTFLGF